MYSLRDAMQALQAAQKRNEAASREVAVLTDYVRALLMRSRSDAQGLSPPRPPGIKHRTQMHPKWTCFFAALGDQFRGFARADQGSIAHLPAQNSCRRLCRGPALDLGCGRGEWLELLREAKVDVLGVEHNRTLTAACTAKNLRIVEADFMAFLEQSPRSIGGS